MIHCENLERRFRAGGAEITALAGVNFLAGPGEFLAVQGPSGCGKSTLLLMMGGMLRPSSGRVMFKGRDLYSLHARERNQIRAKDVGFVFQLFHLIPYLTVRENILAGLPPGFDPARSAQEVDDLLERLGLRDRASCRPGTLSAGERQRTALARALIKQPSIILADEPTGNLDPDNAAEVIRHLKEFQKRGGTVIMVTHATDVGWADRSLRLSSGGLHATSNSTTSV